MDNRQIELQMTVPNQTRYLHLIGKISEILANQLHSYRGDRETLAQHVNVVLTEALVNAIRHANADNPDDEVQIKIIITEHEIILQVFDHGQGFNIEDIPKGLEESQETLDEHGRGLFIMRSLMDSVNYYKVEGGNMLEMRKRLH